MSTFEYELDVLVQMVHQPGADGVAGDEALVFHHPLHGLPQTLPIPLLIVAGDGGRGGSCRAAACTAAAGL